MRGRILAPCVGIFVGVIAAACSSNSQSLIANMGVEYLDSIKPTSWTACTAQGACRFNGTGTNEGPSCARSIEGVVWFWDKNGIPVTLSPQSPPDGDKFLWLQSPKPDAMVRVGESFAYISIISIPATVVSRAVQYSADISIADVKPC